MRGSTARCCGGSPSLSCWVAAAALICVNAGLGARAFGSDQIASAVRPVHAHPAPRAEEVLARARSLFERGRTLRAPGEQFSRVRDGSPTLMALAARTHKLRGRRRRVAESLLARPTDRDADAFGDGYHVGARHVEHVCQRFSAGDESRRICIHWVTRRGDRDAPARRDANNNGRPDMVDATLVAIDETWQREIVDLGYPVPRGDHGRRRRQGPNRGIDIYLANIGALGIGGYCTRDAQGGKRHPIIKPVLRTYVYCVLDNDYKPRQFPPPRASGTDGLDVTVAHEFFHAIQSSYTKTGSRWIREGTATWIEDEVFPRVDDNLAYLQVSPLTQPELPLDISNSVNDGDDSEYGAWVFWRFLAEYFGTPDVVREVWENGLNIPEALAAYTPRDGGCRLYCGAAPSLADAWSEFTRWNLDFERAYGDGRSYAQRLGCSVFFDAEFQLIAPDQPATGMQRVTVEHLSASLVSIASGSTARARVDLELPKDTAAARVFAAETVPDEGSVCGYRVTDSRVVEGGSGGGVEVTFHEPGRRLILGFSNGSESGVPLSFGYSAELTP